MSKDYIELLQDENTGEFYKPYATIVCKTEEDLKNMQEAYEKQVAKEVIDITPAFSDTGIYRCPKCKDIYTFKKGKPNYCSECGQKLDWSEVE